MTVWGGKMMGKIERRVLAGRLVLFDWGCMWDSIILVAFFPDS